MEGLATHSSSPTGNDDDGSKKSSAKNVKYLLSSLGIVVNMLHELPSFSFSQKRFCFRDKETKSRNFLVSLFMAWLQFMSGSVWLQCLSHTHTHAYTHTHPLSRAWNQMNLRRWQITKCTKHR